MDRGGPDGDSDTASGIVAGDMKWATQTWQNSEQNKEQSSLSVNIIVAFLENSVCIKSMQKLLCVYI